LLRCLPEGVGLAGELWMGEVSAVRRPMLLPSAFRELTALTRIGGEMGRIT
jgi:hypothetical protein